MLCSELTVMLGWRYTCENWGLLYSSFKHGIRAVFIRRIDAWPTARAAMPCCTLALLLHAVLRRCSARVKSGWDRTDRTAESVSDRCSACLQTLFRLAEERAPSALLIKDTTDTVLRRSLQRWLTRVRGPTAT